MVRWRRLVVAGAVTAAVVLTGAMVFSRLHASETHQAIAVEVVSLPTSRQSVTRLKLPAELPSATGYTVVNAFPDMTFRTPLAFDTPAGEKDRLFVVERYGGISVIDHLSTKPEKHAFLDIGKVCEDRGQQLATSNEWGVLGLAFHPNYAKNGYFYVAYDISVLENGRVKTFNRLSRFTVSKTNPNEADPKSEQPMIDQLDLYDNHNAGDVHFGNDGYLYYTVADEGGPTYSDDFDNGRYIDKDFFAGMLRIDVDMKPGNLKPNPHHQDSTTFPSAVHQGTYLVPKDNPFIGAKVHRGVAIKDPTKIRTEMYVTGLRNPWRFTVDPPTGRIFLSNVGLDTEEMVFIVTKGGADFGWSAMEGTFPGPHPDRTGPGAVFTPPDIYYGHGLREEFTGNCIIGGVVYRGTNYPELEGDYVYGDYNARKIWAVHESSLGKGDWKPQTLVTGVANAAFGADPRNGDILVGEYTQANAANVIKRLVRAGTTGEQPPKLLSQTGAFTDTAKMIVAPGLIPFTPNVTFWSDNAIKQRWFMMSNDKSTIGFDANGNWTFPTGTIWMKHFDMEMKRGDPTSKRRLETRFLVKTDKGIYGLTYKWNSAQTDAELVPEGGEDETLNIDVNGVKTQQVWHYPSQADCLQCHTMQAGGPLGFNTWQLNHDVENNGKKENLLTALSDAGYFTSKIPDPHTLGAYAAADDTSASLDWRVRSYLGANCVQCHQPGALSGQTNFDARPWVPMDQANIVNGILHKPGTDAANKFAVPQDLGHSMVLTRLQADGNKVAATPRMPPLATNVHDEGAIKLITEWIKSLPKK